MIELIQTINEIVKYGLQPNLTLTDKEELLERNLVKIYNLYFGIKHEFDETNFPDFDKSNLPDIRKNVESNFKEFGLYKLVIDINDFSNLEESPINDAVDDLTDIITDLLEIKWRIETNSFADGLCHFRLVFHTHTQQHILNLLNFLKQKNG